MKIKLLLTGGTIDKKYNELTGALDYADSHIQKMLKQVRSKVDLDIEQLMLVDSLDMSEEQRQSILQACKTADVNKIVITHGTNTMVQTAELLGNNIKDKTIVLLGSMVPYVFDDTDALFNLGAAIATAQLLDTGVYITMNGKIFNWDNVTKNEELGEFQAKS